MCEPSQRRGRLSNRRRPGSPRGGQQHERGRDRAPASLRPRPRARGRARAGRPLGVGRRELPLARRWQPVSRRPADLAQRPHRPRRPPCRCGHQHDARRHPRPRGHRPRRGSSPTRTGTSRSASCAGLSARPGVGVQARLGVEDSLPFADVLAIDSAAPGLRLESAQAIFDRVRAVKDEAEIELLRASGRAVDAGYAAAREATRAGGTVAETGAAIYRAMVDAGATLPALHGSFNSYRTDILQPGDIIDVDLGAQVDGYAVDTARNLFVGQPSDELVRGPRAARAGLRLGGGARAAGRPGRGDPLRLRRGHRRRRPPPVLEGRPRRRAHRDPRGPAACSPATGPRSRRAWCSPSTRASSCAATSRCTSRRRCWSPRTAASA